MKLDNQVSVTASHLVITKLIEARHLHMADPCETADKPDKVLNFKVRESRRKAPRCHKMISTNGESECRR